MLLEADGWACGGERLKIIGDYICAPVGVGDYYGAEDWEIVEGSDLGEFMSWFFDENKLGEILFKNYIK